MAFASLLHKPDILFLDKPTIGLDAVAKLTMQDFVRRINREQGLTTILTTHAMDDIETLCSRVIVIGSGRHCPASCPLLLITDVILPLPGAGDRALIFPSSPLQLAAFAFLYGLSNTSFVPADLVNHGFDYFWRYVETVNLTGFCPGPGVQSCSSWGPNSPCGGLAVFPRPWWFSAGPSATWKSTGGWQISWSCSWP